MIPVAGDEVGLDFEPLAARIRRSSNFRVAWQLFEWNGPRNKATARTARQVLETVVLVPELQTFLSSSVQPIHAHALVEPAGGTFERTLARATADRLGAHSRILLALPAKAPRQGEVDVTQGRRTRGPEPARHLLTDGYPDCCLPDRSRRHFTARALPHGLPMAVAQVRRRNATVKTIDAVLGKAPAV
jgi:hypothetical protein